jgi:hypothetical protein
VLIFFLVFVDFCGANTSIMASFDLLVCYHCELAGAWSSTSLLHRCSSHSGQMYTLPILGQRA